MTLEELKLIIENKKVPEKLVILQITDSDFIPNQYIDFIENNKDYVVEYKENYQQLTSNTVDIFAVDNRVNSVKILRVETFDCLDESIKDSSRTIIVCKKIDKKSKELFNDYIIEIPKLEQWQIEDFVYTCADGVDQKLLKQLVDVCNNNIYRLDRELQKISIFPKDQRQYLFQDFIDDDVFSDLSKYNIFSLTTCIVKRDVKGLFEVYKEIQNIDVEPIGLLILLIQNFRDIVDVQLSVNSSPDALNMKPNKYWAVKYSCGFYTKEELMFICSFLCELDKKIKIGEMPMEHLIDYIITKVIVCA